MSAALAAYPSMVLGLLVAAGVLIGLLAGLLGVGGGVVAVPVLLLWYWFTFFRDVVFRDGWRTSPASPPSAPHGRPAIERDGR